MHAPHPPHDPPRKQQTRGARATKTSAGAVRRVPGPVPLLPALTRSLRAASAFRPHPLKRAETVRSGTLQLYYVNRQEGGPIRKRTGGKPGPPAPLNGPVRVPPRPPFLPPQEQR